MLLTVLISSFILLVKITAAAIHSSEPTRFDFKEGEQKKFAEANEKTAEFIETLFELKEVDTVTMFASSLVNFAQFAAPAFLIFSSILSFLLPDGDEQWHNYISEQFEHLHERFNQIEVQLGNVIRLIKTEVFNSLYEEKRQRIADVRYALITYFRNPSLRNLANAQLACNSESSNPMTTLRHFYARIVKDIPAAGQLSFTEMLVETVTEYHHSLLKSWAGQVFSDVLQTGLLRSQCLSLERKKDFSRHQKQIDANETANITRQIGEKLDQMLSAAMSNFSHAQLEKDVRRNITATKSLDEILRHVFALVVKKYNYFHWYVFVWEGGSYHLSSQNNQDGMRYIHLNGSNPKNIVLIWQRKDNASNSTVRKALHQLQLEDSRKLIYTPRCIEFK